MKTTPYTPSNYSPYELTHSFQRASHFWEQSAECFYETIISCLVAFYLISSTV